MDQRTKSYFVSDVHLGLHRGDPAEREDRFVNWLRSIRRPDTKALYLLGDIWDFWYEYRDVVPKDGARTLSELIQLLSEGVEVYFLPGNHDIWCYSFFESLGIKKISQPYFTEIGGRAFCLGHGDGLGGAKASYRIMLKIFHCRPLQRLFSALHPSLAFRIANSWSRSNRRAHKPYVFRMAEEPLYKYARSVAARRKVDNFVFGHFHSPVDCSLPSGERFVVLDDWIGGECSYAVFDSVEATFSLKN